MLRKIANIIFEWFHLKRIQHEWWKVAWVMNPISVAEHSFSATQIGYILAKMEWVDANKVATMLIWHDMAETRIGDMHTIVKNYVKNKKELELKVWMDQFGDIPFWKDILELLHEYEERNTLEGIIAKDADYLEQAFQAKMYLEIWYKETQEWLDNVAKSIRTESAKKIFAELENVGFFDWWKDIYKNWAEKNV